MKKRIREILVRAVIQDKRKILICKKIRKNYYFFPGGHVEFGEGAKTALIREIKEELGLEIKKCSFIGGSEHKFVEDGKKHHEVNLAFDVEVDADFIPLTAGRSRDKLKFKSREDHLEFFLKTKKELSKEKVLPKVLTKAVLKWLKRKKPFWVSEI